MSETTNEKWRDDRETTEQPSGWGCVIHAEDPVTKESVFEVVVRHVNTREGKGFLPCLRTSRGGGGTKNGIICLGTNADAFVQAVKQGRSMLKAAIVEYEQSRTIFK